VKERQSWSAKNPPWFEINPPFLVVWVNDFVRFDLQIIPQNLFSQLFDSELGGGLNGTQESTLVCQLICQMEGPPIWARFPRLVVLR
jgi:hypothetical protein